MMRRLLVAVGVVMALSLYAAPKASADTFDLNNINCNCLPAGTTSAGSVTVIDNGATLSFTVDLIAGLNFHFTNAFDLFAFNYDGGGTLSLVGAIGTPNGGSNTDLVLFGPGAVAGMDGAGQSFNYSIDRNCQPPNCGFTGGNSGINTLTFTIAVGGAGAPVGGLSISDVNILSGNNNQFAAAVTTVTGSGCTGVVSGNTNAAASTGANSNTGCTGTTVPDGGTTVGLLGLGMLGLGYLRRRLA